MSATFAIKSARVGAFAVVLKTHDINALLADFNKRQDKLKELASFPFILDLSHFGREEVPPVSEILPLFADSGLKIIALTHYDEHLSELADTLGLGFQLAIRPQNPKGDKPAAEAALNDNDAAPNEAAPPGVKLPTLIIDKPVRSGQQIYAKGRDLIVNAMVSEGAEVIADGNIIVFAPVRGRVIAGAEGNTEARIYISSMQAQLVSIAGIYRLFEQKLSDFFYKQNVMITLAENKLAIVALA